MHIPTARQDHFPINLHILIPISTVHILRIIILGPTTLVIALIVTTIVPVNVILRKPFPPTIAIHVPAIILRVVRSPGTILRILVAFIPILGSGTVVVIATFVIVLSVAVVVWLACIIFFT